MILEAIDKISALPVPALGLLRAVHDATVTEYTSGGLPAVAANQVFQNKSGGAITLPAFGAWPAQRLRVDAYAACDGRFWYPAVRRGVTNSYYPAAFERTLYTLAFTAQSLPLEATFLLERLLRARLLSNNVEAVWRIIWEIGMRVDTASPSPVGPNIAGYTWRTPLIDEEIVLTDVVSQHTLGVSLRRKLSGGDEVWSGNITRYGKTLAAVSSQLPTGNNFVLRLRLAHFDITDDTADPKGYAAYFVSDPAKEEN